MNVHKALSARLASYAGLTALVAARIYPDVVPSPAVWPCVTYHEVSSQTEHGSTTDPPLGSSRMQVNVFAKDRLTSQTVGLQVLLALDRFRQTTISGVVVDDCFFMNRIDLFDPDTLIYQTAQDFRVYYREQP